MYTSSQVRFLPGFHFDGYGVKSGMCHLASANAFEVFWLLNQRNARLLLFIPQSDHGIDAHGAARGNIAGSEGDKPKQEGDSCKRQPIIRANPVKKACKVARRGERSQDDKDWAARRQGNSLPNNKTQDIAWPRSQRHTHSDFPSAPRHFVGEQSIQSNTSEQERKAAKKAGKARNQALLKQRSLH